MGKYLSAELNIFAAMDALKTLIKIFPSGFKGDKGAPSYVNLDIVYSGSGVNDKSISGVLMIEIYTVWGEGPRPATLIADTLDSSLQKKTYGQTQFFESSLNAYTQDRANTNLGRAIYSLPFSHFGV